MVTRLIAVGILTDHSGDVRRCAILQFGRNDKEGIQLAEESLLGTEAADQALQIVRGEPGVLPSVALAIVIGAMGGEERIVVLAEIPLAVLAAYEAQLRIEQMPVRMAAGSEILPVLILSEHLCCPCKSSVGKGIFQLEGHGFGHQITRDVTVLHPQALAPLFQKGAGLHRFIGPLIIKAFQALDNGIGNRRDGWIAHHAVGLAAMKMPNREFPLLIVDVKHGVDEIRVASAVDNAVKRHGCPVGIPEGENGVGLVARVGMHKAVRSPVGAVAVAENGRRNHSVEKGGVENLAGPLICRFNSDSREFPVPLLLSAAAHSLEIP